LVGQKNGKETGMKETRELVIRTARKMFAKKGVTETTMDDIAKEAKIGKGTIYHYFDSKEELYCVILDIDFSEAKAELEKVVSLETEPDKKIAAYIHARLKLMGKLSGFYIMFKTDYLDYYGYIKKVYEKYRAFETSMMKSFLDEGASRGMFAIEDADYTAFVIVQSILGVEYQMGIDKAEEIEKKVGLILNIVLNGIRKR
jgi:AcrR family transcriptional regulator